MNTRELCVLDWVYSYNQKCRVWAIDWQNNTVILHKDGQEWCVYVDQVEPIPITQDILDINHLTDCKAIGNGFLSVRNVDGFEYVHELQHALRLLGLHGKADEIQVEKK